MSPARIAAAVVILAVSHAGVAIGTLWLARTAQDERDRARATPPRGGYVQPVTAATLLQCPVSKRGLEEWYRACRARERTGRISNQTTKGSK